MSRLRERLTEVQAAEENDRRRAAYEEARAERDELAAELARVYPPLAAQLADLLDRIEHMNAHALPRGVGLCWWPSWWRAGWTASFRIRSISRASSVGFSCRHSSTIFTRPMCGRDPRALTRGA